MGASVSTLRGTGKILIGVESGLLPRYEFYTDIVLSGSPKTLPPWLTEYGRGVLRGKMADGALETFLGKAAGGRQLEGESLENYDCNSLFYQNKGTVAAAKFAAPGVFSALVAMLSPRSVTDA